MEEIVKEIESARNLAWERIDQMIKSNQLRKWQGERLFYDEFDLGKEKGYASGLTNALQIINRYIQQTTEPVTETGSK